MECRAALLPQVSPRTGELEEVFHQVSTYRLPRPKTQQRLGRSSNMRLCRLPPMLVPCGWVALQEPLCKVAGLVAADRPGVLTDLSAPLRLACLRALERKVRWLSTWMIHNANHL